MIAGTQKETRMSIFRYSVSKFQYLSQLESQYQYQLFNEFVFLSLWYVPFHS